MLDQPLIRLADAPAAVKAQRERNRRRKVARVCRREVVGRSGHDRAATAMTACHQAGGKVKGAGVRGSDPLGDRRRARKSD